MKHKVNLIFFTFSIALGTPLLFAKTTALPSSSQSLKIRPYQVLSDPLNRIASPFKVNQSLKRRTFFWFNIYTKYDSSQHVIHDSRNPWLVYSVVDTRTILNGKGHYWSRHHKAQKLVLQKKKEIRLALRKLSKRKHFRRLSKTERHLYKVLAKVRGSRRNVFKKAARQVRAQLGQKDFFLKGLANSGKYLPHMETVFKDMNLPIELTRLPFVESSFNEQARSRVGASGIWQVMPKTGRALGIVNHRIDERNSPIKATLMAAKILKQNFRSFKNWPLGVTAYNHGIGYMKKSIKKARSRNLSKIISRYRGGAFKFASSNFYTSFLAALHAERYQHEIFKTRILKKEALDFKSITVLNRIRAHELIKISHTNPKILAQLNLDLKEAIKQNAIIPKGFKILVPTSNAEPLRKKLFIYSVIGKKRMQNQISRKKSASRLRTKPSSAL